MIFRLERIARSANPLALLAAAQPYSDNYYQAPKPQRSNAPSYMQSSSTRPSATTRHKGKEIAKPVTPQSESVSEEDSDPEQARRDKDMQKNLALLAKYFKKLYKPTNNNLRTSSNSRNKTEDTTPRECKKPKRVKDYAYHKEKMMMCKQAEQGVPLQAEQADWLEDTDEEIDEQELEAHYSYMAKIQEVSPENSSFLTSPPYEHMYLEKDDSNVIPDSSNICTNDNQVDQNAAECVDERAALANLIAILTLDTEENKTTSKALGEATSSKDSCLIALQTKQTELEKYTTLNDRKNIAQWGETVTLEKESISKLDKDKVKPYDYTYQNSLYETFKPPSKTYLDQLERAKEVRKTMWRKIHCFVHELKKEMHDDLEYVKSLEKEIDELESEKADFSNIYDLLLEEFTQQNLPRNRNQAVQNTNVLKPGMFRIASTTTQTRTPQLPHASRNTNPHMSKSSGVIHTTSVSRPQLKKHVFNSNHDACVSRYLKDVNARTKKPNVVPISASKPKRKANKSVATPHKKTVASDTTIQKSKSYYKELYENTNQEWKWWIAKRCPSGYTWTQNPLRTKKIWMPKIRKDDESTTHDGQSQAFVEKFLGTVRFGNDQFAPILGYGDLIQGNVTIKRVYYVEGLNHNLSRLVNSVMLFGGLLSGNLHILGTEFLNKTLHAYFKEEGIKHQTSIARTPEQNDVVERRNRTLVEAARTMLSASKLPLSFWAEAVATACYTQNRSIIISTHGKTTYHIINDRKPSIKHLHIFGCICYITRDGENLDKMKEKGDPCVMVGYSTQSKGYRVYNKRTRLIVESIHIKFDEIKEMMSDHNSSDLAPQRQEMSVENVSSGLVPQGQKASDYDNSDPVPPRQNVVPLAKSTIVITRLEFLFSPLLEEYYNPTHDQAEENNNDQAPNASFQEVEFNPFLLHGNKKLSETPHATLINKCAFISTYKS
ncbi:retrovirus-related pol polyprotein from transposon TNT 1-94 [Tanacetum coccineum]